MKTLPSLRNNNVALQLRLRINGTDAFINRLVSWSDHAAMAKASALSARICSAYCGGVFDKTFKTYQKTSDHQDKGLLEGQEHLAATNRQGCTVHTYRTLLRKDKTLRNRKDVEEFIDWLQQQGLRNRTIVGILAEFRRVLPEYGTLFAYSLTFNKTPWHTDVLSTDEIQADLTKLLRHNI